MFTVENLEYSYKDGFSKTHTTRYNCSYIRVFKSSLANLCNYFLKTLKSIPIPTKGLATSTTLSSGKVAIPFHPHSFCSLA